MKQTEPSKRSLAVTVQTSTVCVRACVCVHACALSPLVNKTVETVKSGNQKVQPCGKKRDWHTHDYQPPSYQISIKTNMCVFLLISMQ